MKYDIVYIQGSNYYDCKRNLVEEINKLCSKGWIPQGGVSVGTEIYAGRVYYNLCQTMIKEEPREEDGQPTVRIIRT